jgi:hypothetical protein
MNRARWSLGGPALLTLLLACGREPPSAPVPHSLSGHVVLKGYLVDAGGAFAGTRVIGDADGIPVELFHGTRSMGFTTSVDGVYTFTGLAAGDYSTRSRVVGDIGDSTEVFTIANADVFARDTLRLVSTGDLTPTPNPFTTQTQVWFDLAESTQVVVDVLDLSGSRVRRLLNLGIPAGQNAVIWNGLDQTGHAVTGSTYWITLVAGSDTRAHLLFR